MVYCCNITNRLSIMKILLIMKKNIIADDILWANFIYRYCLSSLEIPLKKMRQSWNCLMFIVEMPLLVRKHFYIELAPSYPQLIANKNTLETCKNPLPKSGWSELTKSCTTSTMNFNMAYFSWIPQNNARLKLSCKFGESKCNPC